MTAQGVINMDRKKLIIIIVVLSLIGVLYLVALGVGLGGDDEGELSASDLRNSIAGRFERMFGNLAPRIDLRRIYCNGQRVSEDFLLTEDKARCELKLPGPDDGDYHKAKLEITGASTIWLRSSKQEDTDFELDQPCEPYSAVSGTPRLEVTFVPDGKDMANCWIQQSRGKPISLVVLEGGADLKLECKGCSSDPKREIELRMR